MSNYSSLKATINANIRANNNQEITGTILNSVLNAMVTALGASYQFGGVIGTGFSPTLSDSKCFYLAIDAGVYPNIPGLELQSSEMAVITYDSSLHFYKFRKDDGQVGNAYIGKYLNSTGGESSGLSATFGYCTDYVPVSNGDTIRWVYDLTTGPASSVLSLVLYDSNKSVLGSYQNNTAGGERTITLNNADVAFIRFSFYTAVFGRCRDLLYVNGSLAASVNNPLIGAFDRASEDVMLHLGLPIDGLANSDFGYYTLVNGVFSFSFIRDIKHTIITKGFQKGIAVSGIDFSISGAANSYFRIWGIKNETTIVSDWDMTYCAANVNNGIVYIKADQIPADVEKIIIDYPATHASDLWLSLGESISVDCLRLDEISDKVNVVTDFVGGTSFIGKGATYVQPDSEGAVKFLKPLNGRRYRLTKIKHETDSTLIPPTSGWTILDITCYKNGVATNLFNYAITSEEQPQLADYYDVEIPDNMDADYLAIRGRGIAGHRVEYRVELASDSVTGIMQFNPYDEFLPKFISAKKKAWINGALQSSPLVFAQISDCHADATNVSRAIAYLKQFENFIDFYVNTGDNALDQYSDGNSWYSGISGVSKFLYTIGNHDTASRSGSWYDWTAHVGVDAYNRYLAPYISSWGVTQPTGAATNGYCYYYKDFSTQSIRAIFLDMMNFDSTQDSWLVSTLESARQSGLSVMIVAHFPGREYTRIACRYSSLSPNYSGDDAINYASPTSVIPNATLHVQDFIDAGGTFIGWFVGHTHLDIIGKVDDYPDQIVFSVDTARCYNSYNSTNADYNSIRGTKNEDGFAVISINVDLHIVKIFKVGRNFDVNGVHKDSFCINYLTGEILSDS